MKKITPDKWKHFYVGLLLGAVVYFGSLYFLPFSNFGLLAFSALLVIAISYGFELFSLVTGKGYYDIMDAVASCIGGAIGIAFSWALLSCLLPGLR